MPLEANRIICGDALTELKKLPEGSVDLVCTDPPYGIGFMGKEWDTFRPETIQKGKARSARKDPILAKKAETARNRERGRIDAVGAMESARYDHTPRGGAKFREWFTGVSVEMLRVLKPGAFAFVCIGARQDSVAAVITAMTDAGFKTDFTSIYWTYASGFPKAANIAKGIEKRNGAPDQAKGFSRAGDYGGRDLVDKPTPFKDYKSPKLQSDAAKALDGSYGGFQPKPAVECIIVAMKPLSEKTFVDQALKNGKGITWLDDCRIPLNGDKKVGGFGNGGIGFAGDDARGVEWQEDTKGRFPANLLVSDNVLGDYSRFFSLPFLIVPKAAKSEKNNGLSGFEGKTVSDGPAIAADNAFQRGKSVRKNTHPTVKPVQLMQYLITLGSRAGDVVLDPFLGSGTTALAAKQLGRKYIGIEKEAEYVELAKARVGSIPNPLF